MASYHYLLNGASLQITCSDSKQTHLDEKRFPEVHDDPDGYKRSYEQQSNNTPLSKEWRKKLGMDLAIMFLLQPKSRNSMYSIIFQSGKLSLTPSVDYILTKFPKGYILICDKKAANHDVGRTDAYLYGICFSHFLSTLNADNIFQQVMSTGSVHQLNSFLMLPGSLLACRQVVVGASTATLVEENSLRKDSPSS